MRCQAFGHQAIVLSCLHIKRNNLGLVGNTVTKLGLYVHLTVVHTSLTSHAPEDGAGSNWT